MNWDFEGEYRERWFVNSGFSDRDFPSSPAFDIRIGGQIDEDG